MPTVYSSMKLWTYYANILKGMPPNGTIFDSDHAIALAFGRNSIPDYNLPSICRTFHDTYHASDLPMIQHLNDQEFDPGKPNRHIAQFIGYYIEKCHKPVFAQWELAVALSQMCKKEWVASAIEEKKLVCLWPHADIKGYNSFHVLNDADAYQYHEGQKQYNRPLLLAHDLHMPRVYMLARHIWTNPIVGFESITRSFDPKSVQKMTTSP
ncbi:MAG: hypothetical protein AAB972_01205, partial [Patescibacteria group bacterium]